MFRHIEGCKAQYGDMTLMVAHNFVEWHVIIVKTPTILIQGDRQFSEEKARGHARQLVEQYIREEEQLTGQAFEAISLGHHWKQGTGCVGARDVVGRRLPASGIVRREIESLAETMARAIGLTCRELRAVGTAGPPASSYRYLHITLAATKPPSLVPPSSP